MITNPWKASSRVNPQRENGHRRIASDILRAIIHADLTGAEYKIVLFVIDMTWGHQKTCDVITIPQFIEASGLAERSVRRTIAYLRKKRIILSGPSKTIMHGVPINEYMINKHYDTWLTIPLSNRSGVSSRSGVTQIKGKGCHPGQGSASGEGCHPGQGSKDRKIKDNVSDPNYTIKETVDNLRKLHGKDNVIIKKQMLTFGYSEHDIDEALGKK